MFSSLGQLLVVLLQKTLMWEGSECMTVQGGAEGPVQSCQSSPILELFKGRDTHR